MRRLAVFCATVITVFVARPASGGSFSAIAMGGQYGDEQTSIDVGAWAGTLVVDAPASTELTSIFIQSAAGIFVNHEAAEHLDGPFDSHSEYSIFKATFGDSFGSLNFGHVAFPGLSEEFVANDLTVVGTLVGGGGLGDVDFIYGIPERSTLVLAMMGAIGSGVFGRLDRVPM